MPTVKKLHKLRNRLINLEKQREFEERHMNNPQMITPIAGEIDKIKTEIVRRGFRFENRIKTMKVDNGQSVRKDKINVGGQNGRK